MKKRIVAILLVFTLAMSGNTMAWAAPEGEIVGDDISGEGGNIEKAEEIGETWRLLRIMRRMDQMNHL